MHGCQDKAAFARDVQKAFMETHVIATYQLSDEEWDMVYDIKIRDCVQCGCTTVKLLKAILEIVVGVGYVMEEAVIVSHSLEPCEVIAIKVILLPLCAALIVSAEIIQGQRFKDVLDRFVLRINLPSANTALVPMPPWTSDQAALNV